MSGAGDPDIERVRAAHAEWAKGHQFGTPEFDAILDEYYAADITYRPIAGFAEAGEVSGREAFRDWFRQYWDAWEAMSIELLEAERLDAERILIHIRITGRGRTSGIELNGDVFQLQTVRNGKVADAEDHLTRAGALRAAGS